MLFKAHLMDMQVFHLFSQFSFRFYDPVRERLKPGLEFPAKELHRVLGTYWTQCEPASFTSVSGNIVHTQKHCLCHAYPGISVEEESAYIYETVSMNEYINAIMSFLKKNRQPSWCMEAETKLTSEQAFDLLVYIHLSILSWSCAELHCSLRICCEIRFIITFFTLRSQERVTCTLHAFCH